MKNIIRATALCAAVVSSPLLAQGLSNPTLAERQVIAQVEEAGVQADPEKRAFIGQELSLSPQESARFWPVYDQHQIGLHDLNQRRVENILSYARAWGAGSIDDRTAGRIAREAIAIEEDEAALLKRTYSRASKAVAAAQAARYVQIEAKARAVVRAQESLQVPLVK